MLREVFWPGMVEIFPMAGREEWQNHRVDLSSGPMGHQGNAMKAFTCQDPKQAKCLHNRDDIFANIKPYI